MLTGTNTVKKAVAPALMLALTVMILIPCPAYTGDINAKEIVSLDYEDNRFDEAPPDIRRILERKKLIVAIYCDDKPPFVMADSDGVLQGFDIDIARRIAKLLGVDIEFNRDAKSYNEMADLLVKGKADIVICKFSRTFERAKKVRFSDPYIIFRQTLMINKKLAAKARVEEYPMNYLRTANVKIGARAGTSYVEYAREMFKKAKIVEDSWDNLTAAVVRGDLFGVIRDEY